MIWALKMVSSVMVPLPSLFRVILVSYSRQLGVTNTAASARRVVNNRFMMASNIDLLSDRASRKDR
jgi:hypothetical protein